MIESAKNGRLDHVMIAVNKGAALQTMAFSKLYARNHKHLDIVTFLEEKLKNILKNI